MHGHHTARSHPGRRSSHEGGQSLVEFALLAIPALLLVLGIAQFGFVFSTEVGLTNTARDIARWASALTVTTGAQASTTAALAATELTNRLPANVPMYGASNLASGTVSYCSYSDPLGADAVRVNVDIQYRHPLFLPIVSALLDGLDGSTDNALRVGTSESMRVENDASVTISGITACP
jgi:Flp pilus assembly protein TadG